MASFSFNESFDWKQTTILFTWLSAVQVKNWKKGFNCMRNSFQKNNGYLKARKEEQWILGKEKNASHYIIIQLIPQNNIIPVFLNVPCQCTSRLPSTKSSILKWLNPAITARLLMERVLSSEFSYIYMQTLFLHCTLIREANFHTMWRLLKQSLAA